MSQAADYTVGSTDGTATSVTDCAVTTNSDCTLRDAIAAAGNGDRVLFASSLSGHTITLDGTGSILVNSAIDIVGPGADALTLDGSAVDDSIFDVVLSSGSVHVSGLTFEGGGGSSGARFGGAIRNWYATLTVSDSKFDGNKASVGGAIQSASPLTVQASQFTNNNASGSGGAIAQYGSRIDVSGSSFTDGQAGTHGGAIYSADAAVTVSGSTISGNQAGAAGGGLNVSDRTRCGCKVDIDHTTISDNTASLGAGAWVKEIGTVANSTLSGNHATDNGGGLYAYGYLPQGPLTVANTTISGNIADFDGGGVFAHDYEYSAPSTTPKLAFDSSTIAGNSAGTKGAGIAATGENYTSGSLSPGPSLQNTIVATNTAAGGDDDLSVDSSYSNPFTAAFSLIQNAPAGSFTSTGPNVVGKDPLLAPLADNGGPTQTRALGQGSPTIDAGSTSLTTDQRGMSRPSGGAPDIGAFEVQVPRAAPTVPFTPTPTPPASPGPTIDVGKVKTGRNFVTFTLHCNAGVACAGGATLFTIEKLHGKRVVSLARARKLKTGSKAFSLAAGQTKTIKVKLSSPGVKLMAKFHKLPVRLQVALKQSSGKSAIVKTARATIKSPNKKRK